MSNYLPKIKKESLGELQVTPQMVMKHAPDVISSKGVQALIAKRQAVEKESESLSKSLKSIAASVHATQSTRIKNPDIMVKKIVQNRLMGEKYGLDDVGDMWGGRIIVNDHTKIKEAVKAVENAAGNGEFTILKSQKIEKPESDYIAHHIDIEKNGVKGEIQVMTAHNEARAASTHDAYATHGDNLPPEQEQLIDAQNKVIDSLPPIQAKKIGKTLVDLHKANNDKPLPHGVTPDVITHIAMQGK